MNIIGMLIAAIIVGMLINPEISDDVVGPVFLLGAVMVVLGVVEEIMQRYR